MHQNKDSGDWRWQLANRITTCEQLEAYIDLTDDERRAFKNGMMLPFAITPHYARMLHHDALRRSVVPDAGECSVLPGERSDPLGEEDHRVTPHLIHTYPDKVLLLVTACCPVYCRYCTRSRLAGEPPGGSAASAGPAPAEKPEASSPYESSCRYIEQHPEIRDVFISGCDPRILTDTVLQNLLERLRNIPHIRVLRIGSKVPAVLPMRITDALCRLLRQYRVWLSLHFIHAAELSRETATACRKLSDHGVGMVSQTVLLKGINDDPAALAALFYGLLEINVKPYYLLQCDPVCGTAHFRTSVARGVELIQSLHGSMSGLAVPQYVVDAPGGGGKIPILSMEQVRRDGDDILFEDARGNQFRYPDPLDR